MSEAKLRILLVDDSRSVLSFLEGALAETYELFFARDGAQGLELARRHAPHAVVLDLTMPVLSGADVLRVWRSDPALSAIPVIVHSTEHERETWCLAEGATAFLPKPASAEVVLEAVSAAVQGRRAGSATLAVVPVFAGDLSFALLASAVHRVLARVALQPLPGAEGRVEGIFVLEEEPVTVVDAAGVLGTRLARSAVEQTLVVLAAGRRLEALAVDRVSDPLEFEATALRPASVLGDELRTRFGASVLGVLQRDEGPLALVSPALFGRDPARTQA